MTDTGVNEIMDGLNNGTTVLLSALFLWQWIKSQNKADEREDKLYSVIDTLSESMPQIKARLDNIENDVHSLITEVNRHE